MCNNAVVRQIYDVLCFPRVRTAFDRLFSICDSGMLATPICRMSMKGAAMAMLSGLDGARFMASFGFLISEN